jgi:hypothetical protein
VLEDDLRTDAKHGADLINAVLGDCPFDLVVIG